MIQMKEGVFILKIVSVKYKSFSDEADINILLYLGFVLVAVGVVITSVGLGERGFRTLELRMVGPCLLGLGVMMVTLRLLFCSGLPCTRGLAQQGDTQPIIMVRPTHEEDEMTSEVEKTATRQLIEGKSYKARIIVNYQSYNKQDPV